MDAAPRIGASWRARWDSLRLFTPAAYSALPGMPFPATAPLAAYPTKDEVADYLQAYQEPFAVPVRLDSPVSRLAAHPEGYTADTPSGVILDASGRAGAGGGRNSGTQIAEELSHTHPTTLAVGSRLPYLPQCLGGRSVFWWLDHLRLLSIPAPPPAGAWWAVSSGSSEEDCVARAARGTSRGR